MMKFLSMFLPVLMAGCTLIPKDLAPVSVYDFGPAPDRVARSSALPPVLIQITDIIAPTWLDTQAIRYRLAYHDPARTYTYANSRWAAPPAKLLTERIRQHFLAHADRQHKNRSHPSTNYLLRINLEEFIQVFETPDNSRITVRLRAALYEPNNRLPIAQKNFLDERMTQTADAAGAVAVFIAGSDSLSEELIQWLSGILQQEIP